MTAPAQPVIIVGAGPTGIVAATLLAQHGVESLVLERWPEVYPQPRAVHLDDEIYRVLDRIGIGETFASISRPSLGLQLVDRHHRVLARYDRSGPAPANGHPRASMFDQPDLEVLLRLNLNRCPQVTLRGDVDVTGVRQLAPGRVEVSLTDRASGVDETLEARYVLGCDGANSVVRAAIGSAYEDLRFEQRWLVVDVESKTDLGAWEGVHQVCDTRRAGTYMRIGESRYRWEFQLLDGERATDFDTMLALRPLIEPWAGHVDDADLDLVRVADYTFRAKLVDTWRSGDVFLLGDAAHLTPPFIGQGMGAGVRDAANLSWKLAGVLGGSLPSSVLESYEAERRPHARALIDLARLTGLFMTAGGRVGDALRRVVVPASALHPGLRARLVDSETPALRPGPWVGDGRLAGRLLPSYDVGGVGLDARLGTAWVVVTRRALAPSDRAMLAARGIEVVLVDDSDALATWLDGDVAALVRPDRAVLCSGPRIGDVTGAVLARDVRS